MKLNKHKLQLALFSPLIISPILLTSCNSNEINLNKWLTIGDNIEIELESWYGKLNILFDDLFLLKNHNEYYLTLKVTYNSKELRSYLPILNGEYGGMNIEYSYSIIGNDFKPLIWIDHTAFYPDYNNFLGHLTHNNAPKSYVYPEDPRSALNATYNKEASILFNKIDYMDFVVSKKPNSYYYLFDFSKGWIEEIRNYKKIYRDKLGYNISFNTVNFQLFGNYKISDNHNLSLMCESPISSLATDNIQEF